MSYNRFSHLNKSQAHAVAEAFERQAEIFREMEAHEAEKVAESIAHGWSEVSRNNYEGAGQAFKLAAQDADERAAQAREIAEGKR